MKNMLIAVVMLTVAQGAMAQTTGSKPSQGAQASPAAGEAWVVPNVDDLGDDVYGKTVRYGKQLTTNTSAIIGPSVKDAKMRFSGNNLSCQSCHLNGAATPYAMPWVGVSAVYPQYRSRGNKVSTIEERINGCMERSMNGKSLPLDSDEMVAFVTYMHFLSKGVPIGTRVQGAGTIKFSPPDRQADTKAGEAVYKQMCASCHQVNGAGMPNPNSKDGKSYIFPPLWGDDSFNTGAGMHRLLTAAAFIKGNMPLGATAEKPMLTDDQAYDVAAYINSQPRPVKANLDQDFPARYNKPVDAAFPPYIGGGTAEQHQFGPFQPLMKAMKKLQEEHMKNAK